MQKTASSTAVELYFNQIIELDEARTIFSSESENWLLNIDPNRKVEKQEEVVTEK
jgi:hypothetical protein